MSRIYFHSIDGSGPETIIKEVGVRGSERAYFGMFCADVTWTIIGRIANDSPREPSILRNVFPEDHYALQRDHFAEDAALFFRLAEDQVMLGDKKVDLFTMQLNTAYYLGSDQVRLGVRLHAQCEIHAYVEGHNRKWLADIIRRGRSIGFFHKKAGWESVIKLLEKDDSSPVVTSYSVCDQFPHAYAETEEEKEKDAWEELEPWEQWEKGVKELRGSGGGLEMKPENWDEFYFGDGVDANQFLAELHKLYPNKETP